MGFFYSVVMPMDKHRKIIGNIYFGLGVILLVLLALTWKNNSSEGIEQAVESSFYQSFFIATIPFLAAGVALLGNFRREKMGTEPDILFLFDDFFMFFTTIISPSNQDHTVSTFPRPPSFSSDAPAFKLKNRV